MHQPTFSSVRMRRSLLKFLGVVALWTVGFAAPAAAQEVPPAVQREIERRGLTVEEARREAQRLGIDLSDPEQALQRARALGIPEVQVQRWLQVLTDAETTERQAATDAGPQDRAAPVLAGRPTLTPALLTVGARGRVGPGEEVVARVPLRDAGAGVAATRFFLVGSTLADTLEAPTPRRILGSPFEGTWQGTFALPETLATGRWALRIAATDRLGFENIIDPELEFRVVREGEMVDRADSSVAAPARLPYFGYDLFTTQPEALRPDAIGGASDSYVVGPDDELRLTVWGGTDFQYDLTVDAQGRIYVPSVGQRTVAGSRLGELRRDLRQWLSRSYAGLTSEPQTVFMDLTLTRIQPVQVFVLGEVAQPGPYLLPSNGTVFDALYAIGGPMRSGSLRAVQVVRDGEVIAVVDVYDYLLRGFAEREVPLQDNDRVYIPPRLKTVAVTGPVRRPAIYELQPDESFDDLLTFAGGLEAEAYAGQFQVERIVPFAERTDPAVARTVVDYDLGAVLRDRQRVRLADGDRVLLFSISDRARPAVRSRIATASVGGAVFKPGRYELGAGVRTVRDLVARAEGLTGDAYLPKADLIRLNDDLEREIIALDLAEVQADVPTYNLVLRPQDSLYVYSELELKVEREVSVRGQVLYPGSYDWMEGMTVGDLLFQAGGLADPEFLKDVFLPRADLFRRSADGRTEEIIPFDLAVALRGEGLASDLLRPEDEIRIYPVTVETVENRFVTISGAVKGPGEYRYRDNMTLEDLILQAGGFTEDAYLTEVEVTRPRMEEGTMGVRATSRSIPLGAPGTQEAIGFGVADTARVLAEARVYRLKHRDRVYVRSRPDYQEQGTVLVQGEVRFPGEYTLLRENETLSELIARAGGALPTGYLGGGQLIRQNEQVVVEMERAVRGSRRADIILSPGDRIVVPATPNTVGVRGNVAIEGLIKYAPNRRVSYYLDRAGGTRERAEAIYLTQPSGATYRVKLGLFRKGPVVDDGATILVTQEPPREDGEGVDWGRVITDTMAIVSSTLTIIVLGRQALN